MVKKILGNIIVLLVAYSLSLPAISFASSGYAEMLRVAGEVETLGLGFGGYVLGQTLTPDQQRQARTALVTPKGLDGTYKFSDDGVFVVVEEKEHLVLGIYRQRDNAPRSEVKDLAGELMMQFQEPTTTAHNKLIYWAFGKKGPISEERYADAKKSGTSNVLATVKFSSSQPIVWEPAATEGNKESAVAYIYVMITSEPLSRIFLAMNN